MEKTIQDFVNLTIAYITGFFSGACLVTISIMVGVFSI